MERILQMHLVLETVGLAEPSEEQWSVVLV
jgi:hypothetical protein